MDYMNTTADVVMREVEEDESSLPEEAAKDIQELTGRVAILLQICPQLTLGRKDQGLSTQHLPENLWAADQRTFL